MTDLRHEGPGTKPVFLGGVGLRVEIQYMFSIIS